MEGLLTRRNSGDQGTFGMLEIGDNSWFTLELPWRDNQRSVSCIPAGDYECRWVVSRKYGHVYWLEAVPGRTGILIHAGNLAGDMSLGWLSHSKGCILLGQRQGQLGEARSGFVQSFRHDRFSQSNQG